MASYPSRIGFFTSKQLAFTAMFGACLSGLGFAQQHRGGGGGAHQSAVEVPFPFLDKTIHFPVAKLSKLHFIEMNALRSSLPKGYDGKVKADQQVVLLNYGKKGGGIVRIFETPVVAGEAPESFVRKINEDGFFHNVKRGDWKVKTVIIKGVLVAPTSETPELIDLALKDLKGS